MKVSFVMISSIEQIGSSVAIGFQKLAIDVGTDSLKPNGPEGTIYVSMKGFHELFPGGIESALGKCISLFCNCIRCEDFCVHAVQANEYTCYMEPTCALETN